jgi:hypothetical protein
MSRWFWLAAYLLLVAAIVWGLVAARRWALAELATQQSLGNWQQWRDDVQSQDKHLGPTERRIPKSTEPPALVLMRDYFDISLGGAIVFSTVLYWVIVWLFSGALRTASPSKLSS